MVGGEDNPKDGPKPMKECRKCGSAKYQSKNGRWRCAPCANAYQRDAYSANPELIRARKREDMRRARKDPIRRERINAARRGNPAYAEQSRAYARKLITKHFFVWRARCHGHGVTAKDLAGLWKKQRGLCALSGEKMNRSAHLDHILPISLGGGHELSNLRWLDPWVNVARQNLSDDIFARRCTQVAEWIGRRIMERLQ